MFAHLPWSAVGLISLCSVIAVAQQPAGDPLQSLLIPPEVLIRHQEQIGLSDEQVERIRTRVEKVGATAEEQQTKLKDTMARLAKLLSEDRVDEEAALKQLDQVLAGEKELKSLHMRLLIQIRNDLTAEQRRKAAGIQPAAVSGEELQRRLQTKISQIEKQAQARTQAGLPPLEVIALMQKLPELMQNGQVREAESVLDRAIEMLRLNPTGLPAKIQQVTKLVEQKQQNGEDLSAIGEQMQKVGPFVEQGKLKEAEAILDQVLRMLGVKQPEGDPGKSDKSSKEPKPTDKKES